MPSPTETVLSTLPAAHPTERVLVVHIQHPGESGWVELRQQSFGDGIGWFTQSSVSLEPGQVSDLRNVLGLTGAAKSRPLPRAFGTVKPQTWQPRVVHADAS